MSEAKHEQAKPPTDEQLLREARAFLDAHWDDSLRDDARPDPARRRAFVAKLVQAGWAVLRWPVQWFGRGLSDAQARVVERELAARGVPGIAQDRTNLWANTVLAFGTDALKREVLEKLLCGELGMCLLYSEPGAGSDLAGIRTSAELVGDEYVVNGAKVWTSYAAEADYGMLIARTDWEKPKHAGISFFLCPMKQPGVEVRPLRQITDESEFNEVFLTDVRVPRDNLLGPLDGGWRVLQTALAYERSVMGELARGGRSGARSGTQDDNELIALARELGRLSDSVIRQQLARVIALRALNGLNTARAKADLAQGTSSPIMSLGKLAMSRILHEEARLRTSILGAASLLEGPEHPHAEDANFLTFNAYFTSIGGGTDQIQRNIIGERILGLPKEPEVDRDVPFRTVRGN